MEEKKLGTLQRAQIKRMALGLKPLHRKAASLREKAAKLEEEAQSAMGAADSIRSAMFSFAGEGHETEIEEIISSVLNPLPAPSETQGQETVGEEEVTEGEKEEEMPEGEPENPEETAEKEETPVQEKGNIANKWAPKYSTGISR